MKTPSPRASSRLWLIVGLLATFAKIWLTQAEPIRALGTAALDDRLFVELAQNLVRGEWLGPYNQYTLAKGAGFPLFIAAAFWLGLPLGLAQQLIYVGACAIFARAVRPALSAGQRLAVYLVLLWNPMTYEAPTLGRVIRQNLTTPLVIVVIAGLVALALRRNLPFRRLASWATLTGLAFGWFWITREEGVWLVPSMVLLAVGWMLATWRDSRQRLTGNLTALALLAVMAALPVVGVSWQNLRHYGWFGTVDLKSDAFESAYGAMLRVQVGPTLPQVPVTRQAREAMYAVSPAMAELRPWLEGPVGDLWSEKKEFPASDRQIRGGWYMWALRDAVADAGHATTASAALAFYQRLADQINAACDDGRLAAGPPRKGMLPPWRAGWTQATFAALSRFVTFTATFTSFDVYPKLSEGDQNDLAIFRDLTRDNVASSERSAAIPKANQEALNGMKFHWLDVIGHTLIKMLLVLFIASHLVGLARLGQAALTRTASIPLCLAVAAWGGWLAHLLLNALVQVTSFGVTAVSTFAPSYPLQLIFIIAIAWDAWQTWRPGPINRGQT